MANEKTNNTEIMNDAQLDSVSGGTPSEVSALADALKMTGDMWQDNYYLEKWVSKRLKSEFGITLTSVNEGPNTYTKGDQKLTHLEVMGIIRQKYPYKNIMDDILGTK